MADNTIKQLLDTLRKTDDNKLKKIADALGDIVEAGGNAATEVKALNEALGATANKDLLANLEQNLVSTRQSTKEHEKAHAQLESNLSALKLIKKELKENAQLTKAIAETEKAIAKSKANAAQATAKDLQTTKQLGQAQAKQAKAAPKIGLPGGTSGTDVVKGLQETADTAPNVADGIQDIGEALKDVGWFAAMKTLGIADPLKEAQSIASGLAKEIESVYKEADKATTSFAQFTGMIMSNDASVRKGTKGLASFGQKIIQIQRKYRALGATLESVSKQYQELFTASRAFGLAVSEGATGTMDAIAKTGIVFAKAGLDAKGYGQAIDIVGRTYRTSNLAKSSAAIGLELVKIGNVTGKTATAVSDDLAGAMDNLAAYSMPRALSEFKKLSAQAAVAGIEMSTLMSSMSAWDNIDTAAEKVGELNAYFRGPYLNTLDMVNATESERADMLKGMMSEQGKSFHEMDRFMKKSVAESIGMNVQEAARFFTADQNKIAEKTKLIERQGITIGDLTKAAAKNATSVEDQFKSVKQAALITGGAYNKIIGLGKQMVASVDKIGTKLNGVFGGATVKMLENFSGQLRGVGEEFDKSIIGGLTLALQKMTILQKFGPLGLMAMGTQGSMNMTQMVTSAIDFFKGLGATVEGLIKDAEIEAEKLKAGEFTSDAKAPEAAAKKFALGTGAGKAVAAATGALPTGGAPVNLVAQIVFNDEVMGNLLARAKVPTNSDLARLNQGFG